LEEGWRKKGEENTRWTDQDEDNFITGEHQTEVKRTTPSQNQSKHPCIQLKGKCIMKMLSASNPKKIPKGNRRVGSKYWSSGKAGTGWRQGKKDDVIAACTETEEILRQGGLWAKQSGSTAGLLGRWGSISNGSFAGTQRHRRWGGGGGENEIRGNPE